LKKLDSGFRRNDGKGHFQTFYEFIKNGKNSFSPKTQIFLLSFYLLPAGKAAPLFWTTLDEDR